MYAVSGSGHDTLDAVYPDTYLVHVEDDGDCLGNGVHAELAVIERTSYGVGQIGLQRNADMAGCSKDRR